MPLKTIIEPSVRISFTSCSTLSMYRGFVGLAYYFITFWGAGQLYGYGIGYGLLMAEFLFFKMKAMTTGPILLTSLLGCSSFVLTTIFNTVYWEEKMDAFSAMGMLLMLVALYLITMKDSRKTQDWGSGTRVVWMIYCAFFLLFAASTGIIFKFHQKYDKSNTDQMMIVSAIVAVLTFLSLYGLFVLFLRREKIPKKQDCRGEDVKVLNSGRFALIG